MHWNWRALLLIALISSFSLSTLAAPPATVIQGVAVTGLNRLLGEPVTDFGGFLGIFGFDSCAAYDPNGGHVPLPLHPDTPLSTLLATTADPNVLAIFGADLSSVNPDHLNLPLREAPATIDPAGLVREPLAPHLQVSPLTPSQAEPNDPITLGDWLQGEGVLVVRCGEDPSVSLHLANLVPNRLYTVWGAFETPVGPRPIPVGGSPNVFMTDEKGQARYERRLSYCPFEPTPDGGRLLSIIAVFHSDQQAYAWEPALTTSGFPPGIVAHAHVEFPIAGSPVAP